MTITNLRDGEAVISPFNVRFGVEGYGVCAKGQTADRTGHFCSTCCARASVQQSLDLSGGATQANLFVPPGNYQLRLRFVDAASQRDLLPVHEQNVNVTAQERL